MMVIFCQNSSGLKVIDYIFAKKFHQRCFTQSLKRIGKAATEVFCKKRCSWKFCKFNRNISRKTITYLDVSINKWRFFSLYFLVFSQDTGCSVNDLNINLECSNHRKKEQNIVYTLAIIVVFTPYWSFLTLLKHQIIWISPKRNMLNLN